MFLSEWDTKLLGDTFVSVTGHDLFGFLTVQCDFSVLSNVLCSSATSNIFNCAKKTSKRKHLAEWVQSERDAHCRMWSLGRPHPGLGSPSRRLASDSEGCHWPPWSSSATGPTRPSDSHTHTGWTGGYCENNRGTEIEREEAKEMDTCIGTCCRDTVHKLIPQWNEFIVVKWCTFSES